MNIQFVKLMMVSMVFLILVSIPFLLFAQEPDPATNPGGWLNYQIEMLYGALIVIGGYLTRFIPGLKNLTGVIRVLAWAIGVGMLFMYTTPMNAINLGITYAISTSLYEVIFKWFGKNKDGNAPKLLVQKE